MPSHLPYTFLKRIARPPAMPHTTRAVLLCWVTAVLFVWSMADLISKRIYYPNPAKTASEAPLHTYAFTLNTLSDSTVERDRLFPAITSPSFQIAEGGSIRMSIPIDTWTPREQFEVAGEDGSKVILTMQRGAERIGQINLSITSPTPARGRLGNSFGLTFTCLLLAGVLAISQAYSQSQVFAPLLNLLGSGIENPSRVLSEGKQNKDDMGTVSVVARLPHTDRSLEEDKWTSTTDSTSPPSREEDISFSPTDSMPNELTYDSETSHSADGAISSDAVVIRHLPGSRRGKEPASALERIKSHERTIEQLTHLQMQMLLVIERLIGVIDKTQPFSQEFQVMGKESTPFISSDLSKHPKDLSRFSVSSDSPSTSPEPPLAAQEATDTVGLRAEIRDIVRRALRQSTETRNGETADQNAEFEVAVTSHPPYHPLTSRIPRYTGTRLSSGEHTERALPPTHLSQALNQSNLTHAVDQSSPNLIQPDPESPKLIHSSSQRDQRIDLAPSTQISAQTSYSDDQLPDRTAYPPLPEIHSSGARMAPDRRFRQNEVSSQRGDIWTPVQRPCRPSALKNTPQVTPSPQGISRTSPKSSGSGAPIRTLQATSSGAPAVRFLSPEPLNMPVLVSPNISEVFDNLPQLPSTPSDISSVRRARSNYWLEIDSDSDSESVNTFLRPHFYSDTTFDHPPHSARSTQSFNMRTGSNMSLLLDTTLPQFE
ncbi:hypothetical protein BOTBODRAFT_170059 [Botryobasidium botryosum FD-172 SS1]|uniref:Uncharacterized protein n=1 Tax=Botryobasidium botryosum (strain FD-172 SS1) TaxID=930990 RepID=A0A067MZ96_BOTB1|nr:hypothetical protein BOTBODRAFT_170059 [Botryobasidium botryosum FD-172 SS1]